MRGAVLLLVLASGCGGGGVSQGDAARAASIADRIATEPRAADAILEQEGMDRMRFETMLYEVAADPDATRNYLEARREVFTNPYAPPRTGPARQGTF